MKKIIFALVGLYLYPIVPVSADSVCSIELKTVPECEKLGYKDKNTITCKESYAVCPFSSNYIWCQSYTCADGRYSSKDEGSCIPVLYHAQTCYNCDCKGYSLTACPTGSICESCQTEGNIRYKVTS